MKQKEKDEIVVEARRRVDQHLPHVKTRAGLCLYHAHFLAEVLYEKKIRSVIQAGSLYWPRVRPEQDDGVSSTHFSYVWDPENPRTKGFWSKGLIPELHTWCGIPHTNELVDLTTRYLPEACRRTIGEDWPGDAPPDYLWDSTFSPGVRYEAEPDACSSICALLWRIFQPDYLADLKPLLVRFGEMLELPAKEAYLH